MDWEGGGFLGRGQRNEYVKLKKVLLSQDIKSLSQIQGNFTFQILITCPGRQKTGR